MNWTNGDKRWRRLRLGDVIVRHNEIIHPGVRTDGEAVFVGLEHIESNTGGRIGSLTLRLAELTGRKPTFKKGHIVYGYLRPYLNKVWIAEFDGCSSVDQFAFEVRSDQADPSFIAAYMRSEVFLRRASVVTTTGQLPRISIDEILATEIDLPPLAEQKRIAGILKEQLAAVERARAAADAQLKAAKALPVAYLREVFDAEEARRCPEQPLGHVLRVRSGEFLPARAMVQSGKYPVYGGNGINGYHDTFLFDESKLVIGRVGAQCGCVCITEPKSWVTDNALYIAEKLIPFNDRFMLHYLAHLDLNSKANSMAQPLVTGKLIYVIPARIPPVEDQDRIASRLDEQIKNATTLSQHLDRQVEPIDELPAALLRGAFQGRL